MIEQVYQADAAAMDSLLGNMTEPGGLIDSLGQNADPAVAGRTIGTIANVLNSRPVVIPVEQMPSEDQICNRWLH